MTAAEILWQLRMARVDVQVAADRLICRPGTAVGHELRHEIVSHKPELLAG